MVRYARENFIRDGKLTQTKYHREMNSTELTANPLDLMRGDRE